MSHRVIIEQYERTDPRLGRHVEHDSRSWAYPIGAPLPAEPVDVFWPDSAPILDQGNLGGCVGWTGADVLNTDWAAPLRNLMHKGFFDDRDGLRFYEAATRADSIRGAYPPDDTGSSGLGLARALKKFGLIRAYQHAFTWDHLVAGIAAGPLALGTAWTSSMSTPDRDGVCHVGPLDDAHIVGGHEWMLRGISYTRGLALGRNHWRADWDPGTHAEKQPGEFWVPLTDLRRLLIAQGDVTAFLLPT